MDLDLRDLRYFLQVAQELSFTSAARLLHVSQPAVSKQVRRLEQQLGTELLVRDRRRVALTAAGAVLARGGPQLLHDWQELHRELAQVAAADRRTLRVGIHTGLGRGLLPAAQAALTRRRPGWSLTVHLHGWGDPSAGLRDGSSDLALLWAPVPEDGLEHRVLLREPRWVALARDHPLAGRGQVRFADVRDEPFVALPEGAGPLRAFWLGDDARSGAPARVAAVASSPDEAFEAVAAGTAVVLLSQGNAALYARPDLAVLPVVDLAPAELVVAWRSQDHRPELRDALEACLEHRAAPV